MYNQEESENFMDDDDDSKQPTFRELRLRHDLSLEAIYQYADGTISMEEIQMFDEAGRADPYTADDLLFVLSKLARQHYTRDNIGGITMVLARPPMSPTQPQPQTALRAHPTLLELYVTYALDLDWLGEALMLDTSDVWQLIAGRLMPQSIPHIEALLQLLSRYIGIPYTLDAITLSQYVQIAQPFVYSNPG